MWVRCCRSNIDVQTHTPNTHKQPTQPSTYPAPVEDGGRLEDPPGHVGHLVSDHDSKLTDIRVCVKTGTSHLEKGRRKGTESGVDFASFQKPSLSKASGGLALGTLSWRPQGVPTRGCDAHQFANLFLPIGG